MTKIVTKESLVILIDSVKGSEALTRASLKEFSRDCLPYVMETHDVGVVNRMIKVLTPHNAKKFIAYATNFLPWSVERTEGGDFVGFGKMQKDHKVKEAQKVITEYLLDDAANFWTWGSGEEGTAAKPKNFALELTNLVKKAATGTKTSEPITQEAILNAVFAGTSFDMDTLLAAVSTQEDLQTADGAAKAAEDAADEAQAPMAIAA